MPGFTFWVCAKPGQTVPAAKSGLPLAHMAWELGPGPGLRAHSVGMAMRGGAMVLGDRDFDGRDGNTDRLIHDILHELENRGFTMLVCDFEGRRTPVLEKILKALTPPLYKRGAVLCLPERFADCDRSARVLTSTAVTQGSLTAHLRGAAERCGGQGLILDMPVLRLDITLPGHTGRELTAGELETRLRERGGQSFFSSELCARYFTYRTEDAHHFVIYDDAFTMLAKAKTAMRLGISEGFVLYPEVCDFAQRLQPL